MKESKVKDALVIKAIVAMPKYGIEKNDMLEWSPETNMFEANEETFREDGSSCSRCIRINAELVLLNADKFALIKSAQCDCDTFAAANNSCTGEAVKHLKEMAKTLEKQKEILTHLEDVVKELAETTKAVTSGFNSVINIAAESAK